LRRPKLSAIKLQHLEEEEDNILLLVLSLATGLPASLLNISLIGT